MKWKGRELDLSGAMVMAIVNVTPDSFFSQSRTQSAYQIEVAVRRAVTDGARIIDIGGFSTRPDAEDVAEREEIERVLTALEVVTRVAPEVAVSIDTFRAGVAQAVLEQRGDCIINDVTAGDHEPEIIDVVARYGVPYVMMHNRGVLDAMMSNTEYENVAKEVTQYLVARADYARRRGVENIILDPGFGFAKTTEQNYALLAGMERIVATGYPVLAGLSRKSMIYKVLGVDPQGALNGTTALHWECLRKGAKILRVHDVREAAETIKLFEYYCKHGDRI